MHSFSLNSSLKLAGFELKNCKRQIIGWSTAMFSIMFMYMILFSSMQEMARVKMEALPEGVLQFFGMSKIADLGNYITYFGMIYGILLIAVSFFAAAFSANLIYREEKTKTIEFLYSLEVSRAEIYVSKLIAAFIAVLTVIVSSVVSAVICGAINGGETYIPADLVTIVKVSSFTAFFFMSVSLAIAGFTTKIGAGTAGSMVVLLSYLIGFLSKLLGAKAEWLSYLSPFELFSSANALPLRSRTAVELATYFGAALILLSAGGFAYKRRDFNI
jgi:ABC-2 type transport system permease protein